MGRRSAIRRKLGPEIRISALVYPTLQAASTAMLRISLAVDEDEQIWIDLSMPERIGPITVAPAISCISLVEIEAECRAGTTSIFAGPVRR